MVSIFSKRFNSRIKTYLIIYLAIILCLPYFGQMLLLTPIKSISLINPNFNQRNNLKNLVFEKENSLFLQNNTTRVLEAKWLTYIGINKRNEIGNNFILSSNGNLLVVCTNFSKAINTGSVDITLFEINAESGEIIWNKKWDRPEFDFVSGLVERKDGKIFLSGTYRNTFQNGSRSIDQENYDIYTLGFNPEDKRWFNLWSWGEQNDDEYCNDMIVGDDDSLYLIGTCETVNNSLDILIAKVNSSKSEAIWIQKYGSNYIEEGSALILGEDGYLYALGTKYYSSTENKFYIMKLDPDSGTSLWNQSFGSYTNNQAYSIIWGSDNSLYITGSFKDSQTLDKNILVMKINPDSGKIIWETFWGTSENDFGSDLGILRENLFVAGTQNADDIVILEITMSDGIIRSLSLWGSSLEEELSKLIPDNKSGFYLLGTVRTIEEKRADFDVFIGYFIYSTSLNRQVNESLRIGFSFGIVLFCFLIIIITNRNKI
ncbi:MAG: hypothetical protein ACFE95_10370 [Candidatus Hodarchaeota archaeon]